MNSSPRFDRLGNGGRRHIKLSLHQFYQHNWVAELTSQNTNNAPRRRPNEKVLITTIPRSPWRRWLSHLFFVGKGRDHRAGRWIHAGLQ
jgi:hypothetical protein